jgi:hypothetical protein
LDVEFGGPSPRGRRYHRRAMIARPHPAVLALVLAGCAAPYPEDPMDDEPVACPPTPEQLAAVRELLRSP